MSSCQPPNCFEAGGCACTISPGEITKNSILVEWSHECTSTTSWKVCYKKVAFLSTFDCQEISIATPQSQYNYLFEGLESSTDYKFCVETICDDQCTYLEVGIIEVATN